MFERKRRKEEVMEFILFRSLECQEKQDSKSFFLRLKTIFIVR